MKYLNFLLKKMKAKIMDDKFKVQTGEGGFSGIYNT